MRIDPSTELPAVAGARWVPLTKKAWTLVDEDDYEAVASLPWYFDGGGYARRNLRLPDGSRTALLLHRFITRAQDDYDVDHANQNRLDNRKSNLRVCVRAENGRNQKKRADGQCVSKGVRMVSQGRYAARIQISKTKRLYLGYFHSEDEAARAYDEAAKKHFGEFARTNKEMKKTNQNFEELCRLAAQKEADEKAEAARVKQEKFLIKVNAFCDGLVNSMVEKKNLGQEVFAVLNFSGRDFDFKKAVEKELADREFTIKRNQSLKNFTNTYIADIVVPNGQ